MLKYMNNSNFFLRAAGIGVALFVIAYVFPWRHIQWGKMELVGTRSVTVIGTAQQRQENQIAQFSAGVSSINDDREKAIAQVNENMEKLVQAVKDFGIADEDIQTENVSVFQNEDTIFVEGAQRQRPGQWRVNNSVAIKLRDVTKAISLTEVLTKNGATNVYGPNFQLDSEQRPEDALLSEAIEDARQKAELAAVASGGSLGRVLNVMEAGAGSSIPLYAAMERGGGGAGPIEPGTSTVSKTVTVTFELAESRSIFQRIADRLEKLIPMAR